MNILKHSLHRISNKLIAIFRATEIFVHLTRNKCSDLLPINKLLSQKHAIIQNKRIITFARTFHLIAGGVFPVNARFNSQHPFRHKPEIRKYLRPKVDNLLK